MGYIRIIAPRGNPFFYGKITVLSMETAQTLGRMHQGGELWLAAQSAMDIGVGWSHIGTPAARLRFTARPDRTYVLHWRTPGFGADMDAMELIPERKTPV